MDKDSKGQRKLEDSRRTEEKYNRMEQNVTEITELNRRTIMIALKCANRDIFFYNLTAPRTASNTHAQAARAQSCANRVQHIGNSTKQNRI